MQQKRIHILLLALSLFLSGVLPVAAAEAPSAIINYTIDSGGHVYSNGGRFQLSGTIGQVDSTTVQTAGRRTLVSGFWGPMQQSAQPPGVSVNKLFLPLVNR
jgi:hypothetical protein